MPIPQMDELERNLYYGKPGKVETNSLPKVQHPLLEVVIPSTKKHEDFRPMLVREEKILLTAKEAAAPTEEKPDGDPAEVLRAVKQVVNNCAIRKGFRIDDLTIFDLEYVFLKLRAQSGDSKVTVSYRDTEDGRVRNFDIDLTQVEIDYPEDYGNNKIEINNKSGLIMRYPSATLYGNENFLKSASKDYLFELMLLCVDKIYDEDEVYEARKLSRKELANYLEDLDIKTFEKMAKFLADSPRMKHVIKYTNDKKNERTIELSNLNDFFSFF